MEPGAGDDGTLAGLPWASVFDPGANVRALGEIQKRGLRAAGEIVDRLVRTVDGDDSNEANPAHVGAEPPGREGTELGRLVESWQALLGQLLESVGTMAPTGDETAPSLELGEATSAGVLHFEAEGPGPTHTEVWLHNSKTVAVGEAQLRCSDLLAHHGAIIPAQAVRFDPDDVSSLPPRSSRGIDVIVDVPVGATPAGHYRGTLLAQGHPDVWLPVVLALGASKP